MAKRSVGFVDQHIEKVALGFCALAFLGLAGYYFAGDPYGKNPQALITEARKTAEQTRSAFLNAQPKPESDTGAKKSVPQELQDWFGDDRLGFSEIAGIPPVAPRTQRIPPPLLPVSEVAEQDRHGLANIVAPLTPVVMSGTSTLGMPFQTSLKNLVRDGANPSPVDDSWVMVMAQVSISDQLREFLAAAYKQQELGFLLYKVHLRRKADDEADWTEVEEFSPFRPIERPEILFTAGGEFTPESSREKEDFVKLLQRRTPDRTSAQDYIARWRFSKAEDGTGDAVPEPPVPFSPPQVGSGSDTKEATRLAKRWLTLSDKALQGRKPFREPDPDAAWMLASAAAGLKDADKAIRDEALRYLNISVKPKLRAANRPVPNGVPQDPRKLMPILAHDLTVVPGKTYQYRVAYEIVNVFAGNTDIMLKTNDAARATLMSAWSPPSRPIEVKSDTYFFVTRCADSDRQKGQVQVTVYRIGSRGQVTEDRENYQIGDVIGRKSTKARGGTDFTTDFVVVDLRFDKRNNRTDVVMTYANRTDGSIWERRYSDDRIDARYKDLKGRSR